MHRAAALGWVLELMLQPSTSAAFSIETLVWHTFDASAGSGLAFSGGISSRLASGFAVSFSTLDAATASFLSGLAGTGSAAWLWAMAGAEVGRGLLSGVITATAEYGGETDRDKVQSGQRF